MTRTPAPELSPAEAARVAAFDAAPTPPECDPERVEAMARALWEASHDRTAWEDATEDGPDEYRRLAAAAIAALPPSPAEEAVKRVEALAGDLAGAAERSFNRLHQTEGTYDEGASDALYTATRRLRAALASPAPAPQEPACQWAHGPVTDLDSRGLCPVCAEDEL